MLNNQLVNAVVLALAGALSNAQASTLTVEFPNNASAYITTVGSIFDVQLYADALPDFAGFDFSLTYASNNLQANSLTSADIFGADTETLANSISTSGNVGTIHFAQQLAATSAVPSYAIGAPTLLATIEFKALQISNNNLLSIVNPIVYAGNGDSLPGTLQDGNVSIGKAAAPVPLPPAFMLFLPAIAALFGRHKKAAV